MGGDLTEKPISEVKVGDYVMNSNKLEANEVVFVQKHSPAENHPDLYSPSPELKPFATLHHPLFVGGEWIAMKTDMFPWLEPLTSTKDFVTEPAGDRELYNLWVKGDGTYNVNGYGTHSILFDGGFMRNSYDQGLLDHEGVMGILEQYIYYKKDLIYGAFLFNRLFGRINIKLLNRLCVNILSADDTTKRKKVAHLVMRILAKIGRIV